MSPMMEIVSVCQRVSVLKFTYKTDSADFSYPLLGYAGDGLGCDRGVSPYITVTAAQELAKTFAAQYPQRLHSTSIALSDITVAQNRKLGRHVFSITY